MKFFNKQEQVIDLQLTPYGKYLLSIDKLKPAYYAFFDDGILYDPRYGYGPQDQKEIQKRIEVDTSQLEGQYNFRGVESEVRKVNKLIRSQHEWEKSVFEDRTLKPPETTTDKQYALQNILGTSDLNSTFAPAWDIKFLRGEISSSARTTSWTKEQTGSAINIPQISPKDVIYNTIIKKVGPEIVLTGSDSNIYGNEFIDIYVNDGSEGILLDINEINTTFEKDDFEIEVYKIEDEVICKGKGGTRQLMIPLYFAKNPERVKDGILLDRESYLAQIEELGDENSSLDPSYVEYFLEIDVDHEIDKDFLCKYAVDRTAGIYGTRFLDCEDADRRRELASRNIYNTDVTEEDVD